LDYLIHGFGWWGCASVIYSLGVGLKGPGPCLGEVLCHKKKKKRMIENLCAAIEGFINL